METLFLILGGLAGGFINGFAGTATALFSIGFFLAALAPAQAVAVSAILAVVSGLQGAWEVREEIVKHWKSIALLTLPGMLGVPIGISLLDHVDSSMLRLLVAGLLLVYGCYFGFRKALPSMQGEKPVANSFIGFVGGVLGGLASLSGALPSIWFSMFEWPRTKIRALLQSYNLILLAMTFLALAYTGAVGSQVGNALLIVLPVGFLAALAGLALFRRVTDQQYRRLLVLLCLCLGLAIASREIVAYMQV